MVALIDDDVAVRESLETLLKSAGHVARVFCSAQEFLDSGSLPEANCVVTDAVMPGIDGLELQRRIRAQRSAVPVIFISAHVNDETRRRALREGAVAFLYKPFDPTELLEFIALSPDGTSGIT